MRNLKSHLIYTLAAAFLCYEMALQVSPSIMTEHLMRDLHIDAAGLGLMAGFYFYSYTAMQIPAGLLFDRFSARLLITTATVICAFGALFFGITHAVQWASLGRFMMGVGSAFAFIGVLVVAANWYESKYFALLVGIAQLLAALGAMSGEVPLAAAVDAFGWREVIVVLALFGLLLSLLIALTIQDHPRNEEHKEAALHDLGVKKSLSIVTGNRQTWWVALYAFSNWAPITAFASLWGVPYLMALYKVSSTVAATAVAMIWIGLAIASPILGWLSDRIGRRVILLSFTAGIGIVCSFIALWVSVPFWLMFVLLFGFGIATGGQILSFAVVKDFNRPEVTGTAIGFNNMAVVAGGALFQPFVGWMLSHFWDGKLVNGIPVYSALDYQYALLVVPVCFMLGLIVSTVFIKETYCKQQFD